MKERIQGSKQIKINTFLRQQSETADARGCLTAFNPFRLPRNRLEDLQRSLILKFEAVQTGDVPLLPPLRMLLQRLRAIGPWSGAFLFAAGKALHPQNKPRSRK